ncbi:FAD-dependent oxidoreductase [Neoroseomonas oryzicola]|uniref:NAD(P)-binding protein n=1 Tax=Neoroseomonas oryzicola TaxID=535904 RepID=A0A9X9WED6_9PROT|nr:FAD-dependent monooxygenase [Neoroseomonas oryzicola]MBR0658696.1 NAD(P)-binding protein [Neoroseomonas oryzicola]NKE17868.1 NAD(P)-binding protein [Neoroseomonas oryzicola]
MPETKPVLIAGAGPVGLVAAASLVRAGIPVLVLEAGPVISQEMRASTFHAPTLDMLDDLGAAQGMIRQGLIGPRVQYRTRDHSLIAEFDFGLLADVTRHPYRLQCEQFKLTRILHDLLQGEPGYEVRFDAEVADVADHGDGVEAILADGTRITGSWMVGADGARSAVRKAANIAFEGFTWPERFLVLSTDFDFATLIPGLADVSYYADPEEWFFLLRVPSVWRAMFPVRADVPDEVVMTEEFGRARFARIVAGRDDYPVRHRTLYRVHQRVAETFRRGRILLAGDAAHINNPLGGMGLNGGVHDAVNLTEKLVRVIRGEADDAVLNLYDRQRRGVTVEHVQRQTIMNKKNLEAVTPEDQADFRRRMAEAASDPAKAHTHLLGMSMINSLHRAAEIT